LIEFVRKIWTPKSFELDLGRRFWVDLSTSCILAGMAPFWIDTKIHGDSCRIDVDIPSTIGFDSLFSFQDKYGLLKVALPLRLNFMQYRLSVLLLQTNAFSLPPNFQCW
jgi:hypothetical protein